MRESGKMGYELEAQAGPVHAATTAYLLPATASPSALPPPQSQRPRELPRHTNHEDRPRQPLHRDPRRWYVSPCSLALQRAGKSEIGGVPDRTAKMPTAGAPSGRRRARGEWRPGRTGPGSWTWTWSGSGRRGQSTAATLGVRGRGQGHGGSSRSPSQAATPPDARRRRSARATAAQTAWSR